MLDTSSAIVFNPQLILKPWQYPGIYENFLKWGMDIGGDDPFHRNRIVLDNPTCFFFICENYESKGDYERQFLPFAQAHGIPVRYGLSQHGRCITWLHATKYSNLHTANPEKIGLLAMDYWLKKARNGANLNELHPESLALNEILYEKFAQRDSLEAAAKERNAYKDQFFSLISQIILEEWGKFINRPEYPVFYGAQTVELSVEIGAFYSNYYINTRRDVRYRLLYSRGCVYFHLLRSLSGSQESRNAWLAKASRIAEQANDKWGASLKNDCLLIGKLLKAGNQRQAIREFILRTMDLWRDE